jgi:IS5 family transposase
MRSKDPLSALNIKVLREEIAHYCRLGVRVIDQAHRRVLEGEQVPTSEKIYSIFEPHTDLIKTGQSAHAGRVRPQGVSRRKGRRIDHPV